MKHRNLGSTRIAAMATVVAVLSAAAFGAQDYSWISSATSTWGTTASWSPASPAGGPTAVDSIITPTATPSFGQLQFVTAAPSVVNWTYNSSSNWEVITNGVSSVLTISNTLSKSGIGQLTFRPGGSQALTINVGNIDVASGILNLPMQSPGLELTVSGNTTISGTNSRLQIAAKVGYTPSLGTVSLNGTGGQLLLNAATDVTARTVGALSLSGADATNVVASGNTSGTARIATLQLTGNTATATYGGKLLNNAGSQATSSLSVDKTGNNTQIFSGNLNTYSGGTTISGGTLLANNTTGSATGTGAITVNNGGTLGGTGRIAPNNANGITLNAGGTLAPGASIESLEINLASTTAGLNMLADAAFAYELGAAGLTLAAPGNSDLLIITGAAASDVAFNANVIDFQATGQIGFYKLFDTDLAAGSTWTGLSLSGQQVTAGLSVANLATGLTGSLILGDGSVGDRDDIYLQVVAIPEPATMALMAIGGLTMIRRRRGV